MSYQEIDDILPIPQLREPHFCRKIENIIISVVFQVENANISDDLDMVIIKNYIVKID